MDGLEFAPLPGVQRAQDWMIENRSIGSKAVFARRHRRIHVRQVVERFGQDLQTILGSCGANLFRSLPPLRKVAKFDDHQYSQTLLEFESSRRWLAGGKNPSHAFGRAAIGEGEMLQHFGSAPLPFWMLTPFSGSHTLGCGE